MGEKEKASAKLIELERELIYSEWLPHLSREWPIIEKKKGYRSEIKVLGDDMNVVNSSCRKLHTVAVMEFLKFGGSLGQLPGPYRAADKLKMILFQLLEGYSNSEMLIPKASYYRLYVKFWIKKKERIYEWSECWFKKFSTPEIRLLYSFINSPPLFKHVTLFIDGKDIPQILSRKSEEYRPTKNQKSNLISKKNGWVTSAKVLFLDDVRGFPVALSRVVGANELYDGHLMKEMNIHTLIKPSTDSIIYDHHFDSEFEKMIKKKKLIEQGFGPHNLCPSVTKERNKSLHSDQEFYQKQHGGFRSFQESERNAQLVSLFKRFSKHSRKRIATFDELFLQLRVALVMIGITKMAKSYPSIFDQIDDIDDVFSNDFDFPEKAVPIESKNIQELITIGNLMQENQIKRIREIIAHPVSDFDDFTQSEEEETEHTNVNDCYMSDVEESFHQV